MIVSHIKLKNWRNFTSVDVDLSDRVFLVGPNASGKSNFLDAFRFLRDIAKEGGGLQRAVKDRGGLSKIRCLAARKYPDVEVEVHLADAPGQDTLWKYAIGIRSDERRHHNPLLTYERVWKGDALLLERPDDEDESDWERKTETHLETTSTNRRFREVAKAFESVLYLHLVPQLLRHPEAFSGPGVEGDPFGRSFLERVAKTTPRIRDARLKKLEGALRIAVPQMKHLSFTKDEVGIPHLEVIYEHWRPQGAKQREDQFSDGTLRLIGLLWSLLEGDSLLLLEEPELSLNSHIVTKLPALIHRLQRQKKRQVLVSTHSWDLISDKGIGLEEVLLFDPSPEGTEVRIAEQIFDIKALLEAGMSPADAIMPRTAPDNADELDLFE